MAVRKSRSDWPGGSLPVLPWLPWLGWVLLWRMRYSTCGVPLRGRFGTDLPSHEKVAKTRLAGQMLVRGMLGGLGGFVILIFLVKLFLPETAPAKGTTPLRAACGAP